MNVVLRKANTYDIEDILNLYKDVIIYQDRNQMHQWNGSDITWETLSKLYKIEDFVIGKDQNQIVCACIIVDVDLIYWPNIKRGESLFIHKIAVSSKYRGCGLGKAMLDYFKEQGKIKYLKDVRLDVRSNKEKLRSFYEQNGFTLDGIYKIFDDYDTALYYYKL